MFLSALITALWLTLLLSVCVCVRMCVCACVCVLVCGRPVTDIVARGRVLGGKIAEDDFFPWQVFLLAGGRGGAIIIGEKWLLTAAHNLDNIKQSKDKVKVTLSCSLNS